MDFEIELIIFFLTSLLISIWFGLIVFILIETKFLSIYDIIGFSGVNRGINSTLTVWSDINLLSIKNWVATKVPWPQMGSSCLWYNI